MNFGKKFNKLVLLGVSIPVVSEEDALAELLDLLQFFFTSVSFSLLLRAVFAKLLVLQLAAVVLQFFSVSLSLELSGLNILLA